MSSTKFQNQHKRIQEGEEEEDSSPIHGDILEVVLTNVPLIDLVSACHVSKSWDYAVSSSLSHLKKIKPWLIIHTQCTRTLTKSTTHAFDPRSGTWIQINPLPAHRHFSTLLSSSSSTLVYELSSTGLAFSSDPLHRTWHHIPPPNVWRVDPIVARIGHYIVVAGGALYFEDDPSSVEIYDMETSHWSTCQSIPDILKDSAASTWLSVTSNQNKIYVIEKASGITYSLSPETKVWSGPFNSLPDTRVFSSAIGFAGGDLILAGLIGHAQDVKSLKLWTIKPEFEEFVEIAEIPIQLLDKLKGEDGHLSTISLSATKDFIYVYNSPNPAAIIFCEYIEGSWKWGNVENVVLNDEARIKDNMVMSCANVGIADLNMAMKSGSSKFVIKPVATTREKYYVQ